MGSNTVALTINNLSKEIKKLKGLKDRQKGKYLSDLDKLRTEFFLEMDKVFQVK